jgi:hypothetical protein
MTVQPADRFDAPTNVKGFLELATPWQQSTDKSPTGPLRPESLCTLLINKRGVSQ